MRAYHRIDPLMDERKSHYTPAQLGAFLKVQLVSGRQTNRGRFRSRKHLEGMLPAPYARLLPWLFEQGDLIEMPDGSVYIDGWDEWQEGDITVGERMKHIRDRHPERDGYPTSHQGMPKEPSPGAVRTANWRLRNEVYARDNFTCRYCLSPDYPRGWLVADHVVPLPDGPTTIENLVTACRPCNHKKGGRTPEQAAMELHPVTAVWAVTTQRRVS